MAYLTVESVGTWLASLGITVPVVDHYWVPPKPDELVMVAFSGGKGLLFERAYDDRYITLSSRGPSRQPAGGQALAEQVDEAILALDGPQTIGGVHVASIDRTAPPRAASTDKDYRVLYTAVYHLWVARS